MSKIGSTTRITTLKQLGLSQSSTVSQMRLKARSCLFVHWCRIIQSINIDSLICTLYLVTCFDKESQARPPCPLRWTSPCFTHSIFFPSPTITVVLTISVQVTPLLDIVVWFNIPVSARSFLNLTLSVDKIAQILPVLKFCTVVFAFLDTSAHKLS